MVEWKIFFAFFAEIMVKVEWKKILNYILNKRKNIPLHQENLYISINIFE